MPNTSPSHPSWLGLAKAANVMVTDGHWAALTWGERSVWFVLAKRADETGHCWPAGSTLAREAGLKDASSIYRIVAGLEAKGYVRIQHGHSITGGKRTPNKYWMLMPTTHPRTGGPDATGHRSTDRPPAPGSVGPPAPGSEETPNETPIETPSSSGEIAAVDNGVVEMLTEMGIDEPMRSRLACLEGITPEAVRLCLKIGSVRREAPVGVMVNAVRDNLDQAITEIIQNQKREEQFQATQEATQKKREAQEGESAERAAKAEAILDAMDDAAVEELTKRVIPFTGISARRKLEEFGIRGDSTLRSHAVALIMDDEGMFPERRNGDHHVRSEAITDT